MVGERDLYSYFNLYSTNGKHCRGAQKHESLVQRVQNSPWLFGVSYGFQKYRNVLFFDDCGKGYRIDLVFYRNSCNKPKICLVETKAGRSHSRKNKANRQLKAAYEHCVREFGVAPRAFIVYGGRRAMSVRKLRIENDFPALLEGRVEAARGLQER